MRHLSSVCALPAFPTCLTSLASRTVTQLYLRTVASSMISYSGSGKTFTFLTSIPGRQERRLVHGISARLIFRELKRKLCDVWEVINAESCVVSYGLYSLSMQVTISTQEEWQHALDNDFFVASPSNVAHQGKPILLELRRKAAPPSEAE